MSEIQNWFRETAKEISKEVHVKLTPGEEERLAKNEIVNPVAQDALFRGNFYLNQMTLESIELAGEFFQKAIDIDPEWVLPYYAMSNYWAHIGVMGQVPHTVTNARQNEYRAIAKKLDPDNPLWKVDRGDFNIWADFDWDYVERRQLTMMELKPNDQVPRRFYAHYLIQHKRDEEAMEQAEIALELDPLAPLNLIFYGMVAANNGEYEKTIEKAEKVLAYAPKHSAALSIMSYAYLGKGDYRTGLNYLGLSNFLDEEVVSLIMDIYDEKGYIQAAMKLAEETEKAGFNDPLGLYMAYALAGEDSKAMDALEQGFKDRNFNLLYIGCSIYSREPFKVDDPRFNELLKKMNLPLE
jgi:tetratricopeptide (TPR) repeat protein